VVNPIHARAAQARRTSTGTLTLCGLALALALAGCSKPVEKVEEVRPVRAIKMAAASTDTVAEFSGEVRARYESRLGFRVGGKIVARKVDVGAVVKRGDLLMRLDPQDLQLAQNQANSALGAADSNLSLAKAELARYKELRDKNFVSQAVLDAKESAYRSALATRDQAAAALRTQRNQTGYGSLVADVDGVVTGIDAETGQVVAAGTPVVRLAQLGEKEIVISIPEDQVDALRRVTDVSVRTWSNPKQVLPGKLRELSPVADTATRTYTAKVSIPNAPADVRLGMSAYVTFSAATATPMLKVPLTALVQNQGGSAVWVVENGVVRLSPVQLAAPSGNDMLVASGISAGQTVVTAGVNLLKPGQKVTVLDAEPVTQNKPGSTK
jgi:multidrug efflux system membrane fusion protein